MKCGVGICGSCCVNDDLACRDGTIFDGENLSQKSEFGHSHRTKIWYFRRNMTIEPKQGLNSMIFQAG